MFLNLSIFDFSQNAKECFGKANYENTFSQTQKTYEKSYQVLKRRIGALGKATAPGWSRCGAARPPPPPRKVDNDRLIIAWNA